jgi:hypothetical protein
MAMKRPHAWIILIDLKDDVGGGRGVFGCLHPDGVAALGVGGVGDEVVVFAETFCEDVAVGIDVRGWMARGGETEERLTRCDRACAWGDRQRQSNCILPDGLSCWSRNSSHCTLRENQDCRV